MSYNGHVYTGWSPGVPVVSTKDYLRCGGLKSLETNNLDTLDYKEKKIVGVGSIGSTKDYRCP